MILFYAFSKIEKNPANTIVYAGAEGLRKAANIASMPYTPSKAQYKISESKIYPVLLHDCICCKTGLNLCSVPTIPESHTLRAQSMHQTIQTPKPSQECPDWYPPKRMPHYPTVTEFYIP
jgi:hypothetical protein